MLRLHVVEHDGDAAQRGRHGEEAQRVARRSGVDDDVVPRSARREALQFDESDQFIHAGEREAQERVDVAVVEIRPAPHDAPQ